MTPEQIKHMADRFLAWPLPDSFKPDGGIVFEDDDPLGGSWPIGTNLLTAYQALDMVRHMVTGLPAARDHVIDVGNQPEEAVATGKFGDRISVEGGRPSWLRDNEIVATGWPGIEWSKTRFETALARDIMWHNAKDIQAIRLPANHPYYTATSLGFTYWPGGDKAPDDWDGGDVLSRNGEFNGKPLRWSHPWYGDGPSGVQTDAYDVIGYRPKSNIQQYRENMTPESRSAVEARKADILFDAPITRTHFAFRDSGPCDALGHHDFTGPEGEAAAEKAARKAAEQSVASGYYKELTIVRVTTVTTTERIAIYRTPVEELRAKP